VSDSHCDEGQAVWENPLVTRYASGEMASLWGDRRRYRLWREMWLALAEAESELGLSITPEQLSELRSHIEPINFSKAAEYEKKMRHDVFAHLHTWADQCPLARPILHLGATSAFVTDNTDLVLMRDSLELIEQRLVALIESLAAQAMNTRNVVCLGLTHLQSAQPTTIGKRICLWIHDLLMDLDEISRRKNLLRARGAKGTTGTQASFLELFAGDHEKVRKLDQIVARKIGFAESYMVTGQTYSRKVDSQVVAALAGLCESAHKAGNDLRIAASRGELEEPFEDEQVGSSAMPYKRNPMRAERICSLSRFVMGLASTASQTAAVQWFERTLDDSAARRLVLPQAFLATDAVLVIYTNIARGLVVQDAIIEKNLRNDLPFLASERILMAGTTAGGDRQSLHEALRHHSHAATAEIRKGRPNDLLQRLKSDPLFASISLDSAMETSGLAGRAPQQVEDFIGGPVAETLALHTVRPKDASLRV